MEDVVQIVAGEGCDEHVNVIGGDDKVAELIALTVEEFQGVLDDVAAFWECEQAGAGALVEPKFEGGGEVLVVVAPVVFTDGFGVRGEPVVAVFEPAVEFVARQGIDEAEGDEVGGSGLVPVGEIGAGDIEWGLRVEEGGDGVVEIGGLGYD